MRLGLGCTEAFCTQAVRADGLLFVQATSRAQELFMQLLTHTQSISSEHLPTASHHMLSDLGIVRKKDKQEDPQTAGISWCSDEKIKDISPKSIYSCADIQGGYV